MVWWTLFSIGWILFISWVISLPSLIWFIRDHRLFEKTGDLSHPSQWPFVSVVVPARDEEDNVEVCLRSLLNMDYPRFEVIAVDDRSRDQTGAIMDRIAEEYERLRVIHVSDLPPRWIGKNHAMWKASEEAAGNYILFTDGDVIFEREALKKAMLYMTHEKLDHLCLIPELIPGNYWENALTNYFGFMFVMGTKPQKISSSSRKHYGGVGAFNLVRKEAYDKVGGHEHLRLEIVDDFQLGKVLKESGFRQDMLVGSDLIRVKWQEGVMGVVRGLEKNLFALLDYSLKNLIFFNLTYIWYLILPYLGLIYFRDERIWGYALTVVAMHALYGYAGSQIRFGWGVFPALPVVIILYWWTMCRSAFVTLKQGGVKWRDTFYPLEILKGKKLKVQ